MEKEKLRCFIAVNLPKNVKDEIVKIQEKLPEFFGKKTEYENLHLTLKFLGEVDIAGIEKIRGLLREIKMDSFECEIGSIGIFSKEFIRIIWLSLIGCEELQKKVEESLGDLFESEERFMGHLTIARVKNVRDKKEFLNVLKEINIPRIKFKINEFYLMSSVLGEKGPKYSVIEKYKLI